MTGGVLDDELGFTILELVMVLLVVSLIASMTAASLAGRSDQPEGARDRLEAAMDSAARSGRPVMLRPDGGDTGRIVRVLPDGRIVGIGIDPLAGEPSDTAK